MPLIPNLSPRKTWMPSEIPGTRRARHHLAGTAKVLIVEDAEVDRKVLERLLVGLGCTCVTARDGAAGVSEACQGDYDFVFMDVEMPRMDGVEATARIHTLLGPKSPFIVAVTAHRGEADKRRCEDAGMDYFLEKPVHRAALDRMVVP